MHSERRDGIAVMRTLRNLRGVHRKQQAMFAHWRQLGMFSGMFSSTENYDLA